MASVQPHDHIVATINKDHRYQKTTSTNKINFLRVVVLHVYLFGAIRVRVVEHARSRMGTKVNQQRVTSRGDQQTWGCWAVYGTFKCSTLAILLNAARVGYIKGLCMWRDKFLSTIVTTGSVIHSGFGGEEDGYVGFLRDGVRQALRHASLSSLKTNTCGDLTS